MFTSLSFAFGKMGITSKNCLTNQQINSIIVNNDHDYRFVYYLLKAYRPIIFSYNSGIDTPIVPKSVFEYILVKCPLLPTQRKIAAILSAYDDLIENNKQQISLLENMAEEIYREWFVRFRFPGYKTAEFEKGIPNNWSIKALGNICSEIKDSISKDKLDGKELYMGLEHLSRKSISIKISNIAESINSNKLMFKENDILFGKIRPYLHKVNLSHISGACSSDIIVLRPKRKRYEAFILFTIFSNTFIEIATTSSKGTKMPRADWDFLSKLELPIPDRDLLMKYQGVFNGIFDQICNFLDKNKNLEKTKNMLLPRLISGKLSVEDLDIKFPPSMQEEHSTSSRKEPV